MKKRTQIALAILASRITDPRRIQVLPDGFFASIDGRPDDVAGGKWLMDQEAADAILAAAKGRVNDFVIDYDHQTLYTEKNGQAAPAAGWAQPSSLEYVPGEGLFAIAPKWTGRAQEYLDKDEYRYLSPVFEYDRTTGRPTRLRMLALVNDAGVDGMAAVTAALKSLSVTTPDNTNEDSLMNELLKKLLARLGIEISDADMGDEAKLKAAYEKALAAADEMAKKTGEAVNQVAALKANADSPDPLKFVPIAVADELRTQLVALKGSTDAASVDQLIEGAKKEGRLVASEEKWARDLAKQHGFATLKANLEQRPAIAALKGLQVDDKEAQRTTGKEVKLTATQLAVCKATGIDPKDYAKTLQEDA